MKKTLLISALLVSSFAGMADAGTPMMLTYTERPCVIGDVYAGYQNNYAWHGLVPSSLLVDQGSYSAGLRLMSQPKEAGGFSVFGTFRATHINSNNDLQNHLLAEGIYAPWAYNNLKIQDEANLYAGIRQELGSPDWSMTLGYRMIQGGMAGLASDLRNARKGDTLNQMDHQGEVRILFSPEKTGFFIGGGGAYSFDGARGWLVDGGLGFKWDVCNNVSAILSGNAYFSFNYWNMPGKRLKGSDGYEARFTMPIQASRHMTVAPYVAVNFEGSNSDHASSRVNEYLHAAKATRHVAVIAGFEVCYTF